MDAFSIPNLSNAEWLALLAILAGGYVATEFVKRMYRLAVTSRLIKVRASHCAQIWRSEAAWLVSVVFSTGAGILVWPDASVLPGWLVGLVAGGLNSVAVKLFAQALHRWSPAAAAAFTGNRRKHDKRPPGGIERRGQ